MVKKLILIIIMVVILPLVGECATIYVATDGDDLDAGTYAAPWATWQKAFQTATAGDTVYFRGGVYTPTVASINTPHEDGNGIIPDGIIIYVEEPPVDRVAQLEAELATWTEPSDEELIMEGKMMHPYYMLKEELEMLKAEE